MGWQALEDRGLGPKERFELVAAQQSVLFSAILIGQQ
jgi:hypothetical protein